jgi:uncharacterized short protein YbdD (DUF466 family)
MKRSIFAEVRETYHGLFGVPDYEAYLRHMQVRHPGEPALPEKQFAAEWIDRKYGGTKGARCC